MTTVNAPERLRRQEHDTGDPDDTVFVGARIFADPQKSDREFKTYHDDYTCHTFRRVKVDEIRTLTRESAQTKWYGPCCFCTVPEYGGPE